MSGICGSVSLTGDEPQQDLVRAMLETVRRRGPDAEEVVCAGSAALGVALQNFGRPADGIRPVGRTEEGVLAAIDGWITNADSLRADLEAKGHKARADSQQDLVALLYSEFPDDFAERIEGCYSIAVWDARAARLTLVRDRIGTKPLYYADAAGRLLFSSSVRALRRAGVPDDLDLRAIDGYLSSNSVPGPGSIYRAIQKLPPAHVAVVEKGGVRQRRYWDLIDPRWDDEHRLALDSANRKDAVWQLLKRSVDRMAPSETPVGVFLGGGPDAAAIVAALRELGRDRISTFTAAFHSEGFDESEPARITARHFETDHHEILVECPSPDTFRASLRAFDEPYGHPSGVALYVVAEQAGREVRIALGGESADDLFAGNTTHLASKLLRSYNRLPRWLRTGLVPRTVGKLPLSYSQLSVFYRAKRFVEAAGMPLEAADAVWKQVIRDGDKPGLYGPALLEARLPEGELRSRPYLDRAGRLDLLSRLVYAEMQMSLVADVLNKHDRMPAAHGIENRGPYTNRRLAEFAFRLPLRDKIRGLRTKHLLREMLKGRVPATVVNQRKIPFNSPASEWLNNGLREFLCDTLTPARIREDGLLRPQSVDSMIRDHLERRKDYGPALWNLLSLTIWLDLAKKED